MQDQSTWIRTSGRCGLYDEASVSTRICQNLNAPRMEDYGEVVY